MSQLAEVLVNGVSFQATDLQIKLGPFPAPSFPGPFPSEQVTFSATIKMPEHTRQLLEDLCRQYSLQRIVKATR